MTLSLDQLLPRAPGTGTVHDLEALILFWFLCIYLWDWDLTHEPPCVMEVRLSHRWASKEKRRPSPKSLLEDALPDVLCPFVPTRNKSAVATEGKMFLFSSLFNQWVNP